MKRRKGKERTKRRVKDIPAISVQLGNLACKLATGSFPIRKCFTTMPMAVLFCWKNGRANATYERTIRKRQGRRVEQKKRDKKEGERINIHVSTLEGPAGSCE